MNKNKTRYNLNFYQQAIQDILDRSNYGFIGKQMVRSMLTSTITSSANSIPFRVRSTDDLNEYYMEIDEDDWNDIKKIYGNRASIDGVPIYDPLKPECHRLFFTRPGSIKKKISVNYTQDLLNSRKVRINIQIGD